MKKLTAALLVVIAATCLSMAMIMPSFAKEASNDGLRILSDLGSGKTASCTFEKTGFNDKTYGIIDLTKQEGNKASYTNDKPSSGWYVTYENGIFTVTFLEGTYDPIFYIDTRAQYKFVHYGSAKIVLNVQADTNITASPSSKGGETPTICAGGDVTITGPGTLTIGSKEKRVYYGICSYTGNVNIKDAHVVLYSKYDGILDFKNDKSISIENSTVIIDDEGLTDTNQEAAEACMPTKPACGIHSQGDIIIDSSTVKITSQNRYGIYAQKKLTLKNTQGAVTLEASSGAMTGINVEDIVIPDDYIILAGADKESATEALLKDVNNTVKYVSFAPKPAPEPEPEPEPEIPPTGDTTPLAGIIAFGLIAVAGCVFARRRMA